MTKQFDIIISVLKLKTSHSHPTTYAKWLKRERLKIRVKRALDLYDSLIGIYRRRCGASLSQFQSAGIVPSGYNGNTGEKVVTPEQMSQLKSIALSSKFRTNTPVLKQSDLMAAFAK